MVFVLLALQASKTKGVDSYVKKKVSMCLIFCMHRRCTKKARGTQWLTWLVRKASKTKQVQKLRWSNQLIKYLLLNNNYAFQHLWLFFDQNKLLYCTSIHGKHAIMLLLFCTFSCACLWIYCNLLWNHCNLLCINYIDGAMQQNLWFFCCASLIIDHKMPRRCIVGLDQLRWSQSSM